MSRLRVLQCGVPKSGNYVAFRIVASIMEKCKAYRSFTEESGIGRVVDGLFEANKFFPLQSRLDMVRLVDGEIGLVFPHPELPEIPVDRELLTQVSTFLWTHEFPDVILDDPIAKSVTHGIYVLRDGRDVLNSMIHWVTKPLLVRLKPAYSVTDPDEMYEQMWYVEKLATHWKRHVTAYLDRSDRWFGVRYEWLLDEPRKRKLIADLGAYLDVPLNGSDIDQIMEQTHVKQTKAEAPHHVRKARKGDWREKFRDEHRRIVKACAGDLLIELGYERDDDW